MNNLKYKKDRIINKKWVLFPLGEQIKHLEVEGFLVIPDILKKQDIKDLVKELSSVPTVGTDYTEKKQTYNDIQWFGGKITELIANPKTIKFLKFLFGDDPILMTYDYSRSEPGCPAINLHCDGQPWGSKIFGADQSCPRLIRVLYFLQDITPETGPFRVVPRSHLSFHNDANPYLRYLEHPEQAMVTCTAGSVILINQSLVHGNYQNKSEFNREMLGLAYRPSWAGPIKKIKPWPKDELAKVSSSVRKIMGDKNKKIQFYHSHNVPENLKNKAHGINPSRWELKDYI